MRTPALATVNLLWAAGCLCAPLATRDAAGWATAAILGLPLLYLSIGQYRGRSLLRDYRARRARRGMV